MVKILKVIVLIYAVSYPSPSKHRTLATQVSPFEDISWYCDPQLQVSSRYLYLFKPDMYKIFQRCKLILVTIYLIIGVWLDKFWVLQYRVYWNLSTTQAKQLASSLNATWVEYIPLYILNTPAFGMTAVGFPHLYCSGVGFDTRLLHCLNGHVPVCTHVWPATHNNIWVHEFQKGSIRQEWMS